MSESQIAADARQKTMPFFLISFFSLTMSVFIIYSSYKVITLDRLPVIGTFRSIGATQKAVVHILFVGKRPLWRGGRPDGDSCWRIGLKSNPGRDGNIPISGNPNPCYDFSIQYPFPLCCCGRCFTAIRMASGAPGKPAADQGRGNGTGGGEAYSQAMDCRSRSRSFTASILLPRLTSGTGLYLAGDCPFWG